MDGSDGLRADDPRWIGAYRLLGRLGVGGMGRVYLARSARGRTVAVKLVRPDLAEREEFRSRFRREVQAARRVGGRWTAPVLDADTEAEVPWVATGYVPGPSLHQVVAKEYGPLPERSVRVLAAGLAHALGDIHAAGLVHRDLKPSNVMITIDGPRVIDFGIARALETVADGSLTVTGAMVGSPGFMSPEQVRGDRVTPACDIFCLGSVLAYAATGLQPFGAAASGVHAQMYRIVQEPPDLAPVPAGLRPLVAACLVKEPDARPSLPEIHAMLAEAEAAADAAAREAAPGEPGARSGLRQDPPARVSDEPEPWLPAAIVARLGRHAVRLLELEAEADTPPAPPQSPATQDADPAPKVPTAPQGAPPQASQAPREPAPPSPAPQPAAPPAPRPPAAEAAEPPHPATEVSTPSPGHHPAPMGTAHPTPPPAPMEPTRPPIPPGTPLPTGPAPRVTAPSTPTPTGPPSGVTAPSTPTPTGRPTSYPTGVTAPYDASPTPPPPTRGPVRRRGTLLAAIAALVVVAGSATAYTALRHGSGGSKDAKAPASPASQAPGRRAKDPGTPPAKGLVPAGMVGVWRTSFVSADQGDNTRTLTVRADGTVVLTGESAAYSCSWRMRVTSAGPPVALSASQVTGGDPLSSCSPGDPTTLTLLDATHLRRDNEDGKAPLTYTKAG